MVKLEHDVSQWDDNAELYDEGKGDSGDDLSRLIDPVILSLMGDVAGCLVVDAGCGNGYLAYSLTQAGAVVIGLDGSAQLVALAKQRWGNNGPKFGCCDLRHPWPVETASVDVTVSSLVLQYVDDIGAFAVNARAVLKSNGRIVVAVDHPAHGLFMRALRLAGTVNEKFESDVPYLDTEVCRKRSLWGRADITYIHRPLSSYVEGFVAADFVLTAFRELGQTVTVGNVSDVVPRVAIMAFTPR